MNPPSAQPSSRFSRAARAERDRLQRRREAAEAQIEQLTAELQAAERALHELDQQMALLERMSGLDSTTANGYANRRPSGSVDPAAQAGESGVETTAPGKVVTGAGIRAAAVDVYLRSPYAGQPMHYRRWLQLLEEAGYRVQGKRPEAVFLGQLTRSPVVRGAAEAGHYELDNRALDRLVAERQRVERELLDEAQPRGTDPESIREAGERQSELMAELRRIQRDFEEASHALGFPEGSASMAA